MILQKRVNMKKTIKTVCCLLCVMCLLTVGGYGCGARQRTIIFREHLDDVVLKLDGEAIALRETALYVAYQERSIQEQALLYDPKDPNAYWNTHMNGRFIRLWAREEAMNQMIHDLILYQEACEMGMELTQEERDYALSKGEDFWSDMETYGQTQLGISKEEWLEDVQRMAIAQKYQELLAAMDAVPLEDYDTAGIAYEKMLEKHEYKIITRVWEGITMGRVTYEY